MKFPKSRICFFVQPPQIKIFDTSTGNELASKTITVADEMGINERRGFDELAYYRAMEELSPVLTSSENFLYVLEPNRTKVHVREIKTLNTVAILDVPENTTNVARVGFQTK